MDKTAALKNAYRLKRKSLEEQKETLLQQRDKAISTIEEVEERSYYYLKDAIPDNTMLMLGYRQTDHMKTEVLESTKESLKKIAREIEKCDEAYYKEL